MYSLRNILSLLFCLSGLSMFGQTVKIMDKLSYSPVPNAVIVNSDESLSVQTNSKGYANLDIFIKNDTLHILHTSYTNIIIDFETLEKNDFKVYLMPAIIQLDEMVISASRREESKHNIPYKISIINPKEIEIYQPQTSADMLGVSREVFVQKSQMGGGSPMLRGFGSNRVLLVVDGVRMNNAIYRHGNLHNVISLDANSIESVEVIHGPGSVMYGSDAIGGVFSFNTKTPEFSDGPAEVSANTLARFSSANFEKTGAADISISKENIASLTSFSYSSYNDLISGRTHITDSNYLRRHTIERWGDKDTIIRHTERNVMRGTAYSFFNIMQKLRYKITDSLEFTYGFHYSQTSDIPRFDRLNEYRNNVLRFAEWYYGPQKWMLNNLQMKYTNQNKYFDELNLNIAYQKYEESRHNRNYKNDYISRRFENVNAITGNFDFFKVFSDKHNFNYGLELVHNNVSSSAYRENIITQNQDTIPTRYPDYSTLNSVAAYLSYKYYLNNKIVLNGGLRYSYTFIDTEFDSNLYDFPFENIKLNTGAPTASIGGIYKYNSRFNINFNLSSGFRAPNVDDLAKVFDSEPGAVVVPNKNLKPEYIYSADLGIIQRINDKLEFHATGFYSYLKNIMVREDFIFNDKDSIMYDGSMSKVQAIVNNDYAVIYGASAGIKVDLNDFISFKSNITWMDGYDNNNNPMRHVTPIFGSTHLILKAERFKLDIYTVYNGKISAEKLSPEEHGKNHIYARDFDYAYGQSLLPKEEQFNPDGLYSPAWYTINFNMSYQLSEQVGLNIGIENITNVLYRTYSSGVPAFGRNIVVGFRGNF